MDPGCRGFLPRSRTEKEWGRTPSSRWNMKSTHCTPPRLDPFVTFGFGLGTSWESRLIQESILKNRISGRGNKKTAVFPKLVFAIRDARTTRSVTRITMIETAGAERAQAYVSRYSQLRSGSQGHRPFKTPMGCRSFLGVYEENGEMIP